MGKEQKQNECRKCFYFRPHENHGWGDYYTPAKCMHDRCFVDQKYQTEYGEIKTRQKRIKDIIDLRNEETCRFFRHTAMRRKMRG